MSTDYVMIEKAKTDVELRNKIIMDNYSLIVDRANKFAYTKVPIEDMITEGVLGFIEAIKRFDTTKGTELSTYATIWINRYIVEYIASCSLIKLPPMLRSIYAKINAVKNDLRNELDDNPTDEEVAERLGMTLAEYNKVMERAYTFDSFDALKGNGEDDGDATLYNLVADECDVTAEYQVEDRNKTLYSMLDKLTTRESLIIKYRFGLEGGRRHSLEEIGEMFGMKRERIRQIESKAMRNLRSMHSDLAKLSNY